MISFNLHIPSIFIGFLIGYIVVSALWIVVSFNENWDRGFSDGYRACSEFYKLKSEKTKNDEIYMETGSKIYRELLGSTHSQSCRRV